MNDLDLRRDMLRSMLMRDFMLRLFSAWTNDGIVEVNGSGYSPIRLTLADWKFDEDGLGAKCANKTFTFDAPLKRKIVGYYLSRPDSPIPLHPEAFQDGGAPKPVEFIQAGGSLEIESIPISIRPKFRDVREK